MRRKPDFFIVGAPKCGTTALYEYLRAHPDVFMPSLKEIHYFGSDLHLRPRWLNEESYLELFEEATPGQTAGEASVWYLYSEVAASEIKNFSPDARIIILLRNPADMLFSQHSQFLYNQNEDITDFRLALQAETDRKSGLRVPPTATFVPGLYYSETIRYTQQIIRYLDTFGNDRVLVVLFDDFIRDTKKTYQDVLRFLNVKNDYFPDFNVVNPHKIMRNKKLATMLYEKNGLFRSLARRLLPIRWRTVIWSAVRNWNTVHVKRIPIEPSLRAELLEKYSSEIDKLEELLGRKLPVSWRNSTIPSLAT